MRRRLQTVVACLALFASSAFAQKGNPCAEHPCNVLFDWGGSSNLPDVDPHYGNPSELEARFLQTLQTAGFRFAGADVARMTVNVRLTPQTRLPCDAMPGNHTLLTCHSVARAVVVFVPHDSTEKAPPRVDISPRCSDILLHPAYAAFGEFAAQTVVYVALNQQQGERPSLKCT